MKIFGVHFHNWEPIFSEFITHFLNEKVKSSYVKFRYCNECGTYQEDQHSHWQTLTPQQAIVLASKLVVINKRLHVQE